MGIVQKAAQTIEQLAPAHFEGEAIKLHYMNGDWRRLSALLEGPELEKFVIAALIVMRQHKILCAAIDKAADEMRGNNG